LYLNLAYLQFRFQDLPHPHNVRRRIHQLKDFIRVTPEWINYALIDDITDSFAPLIQHTELEVDSIDDLVLVLNGSEQNDMLRRIGSCRKTVMQLLRLLGPKADVLRGLIKRYEDKAKEVSYNNNIRLRETHATAPGATGTGIDSVQEQDEVKVHHEVTLYLGDIQGKRKKNKSTHLFKQFYKNIDHILTMLQNVNHYDLILGRAHRNYLGQISIELSQAGNTTNEVINRLTFFATIIVPLVSTYYTECAIVC
jgi:Mg2+ and Co2+ transporter CorA